jgi:hypothetical protein
VGLETQGWIDHGVFFDRGLGFGGGTDGTFQHKDYALSSYFSAHPGPDRIRPVLLLGVLRARSHYFVFDPGSNQIRRREEHVAAPGLLVGFELPVNPSQRVTFTTRFEVRFVGWLPEVSNDGLSTISVIVGAGVQFRLR